MRKTRNDRDFWYCLYLDDRTPGDTSVVGVAVTGESAVGDDEENENRVLDENGNETGELILHYAAPVKMYANVSPAGGNAERNAFGISENYDKVIVTHDVECPITESTVLFIDKEPEFAEADTHEVIEAEALYGEDEIVEKRYVVPVYDYIVRRVSRSLNEVQIAVSKVSVG